METLTFKKAVKIWWGFTWRSYVLLFPLGVLLAVFAGLLKFSSDPRDPQTLLPVLLALMLVAGSQIFAFIWLFRTKWSDFYLATPAREKNDGSIPK